MASDRIATSAAGAMEGAGAADAIAAAVVRKLSGEIRIYLFEPVAPVESRTRTRALGVLGSHCKL